MNHRCAALWLACAIGSAAFLPAAAEEGRAESHLSVPESGVGSGIADRELEGEGDRFAEGTAVVFWTRVVGGQEGERIRHVWLREGQEVISIGLTLGGPQWRTYSRKTLHPGSAGNWTVEARDGEDRVIARAEFVCVGDESATEPGE